MTGLENRYRRLVALYPRDHRERHGDEMLGVLLDGSGEHARPGLGETVNLLWSAVLLHLRRVVTPAGIPIRDMLASVALLGPLTMLLGAAGALQELVSEWRAGTLTSLVQPAELLSPTAEGLQWQWSLPDLPVWMVWFVVAVLAMFRLRRTAAVGAWLGTVGFVSVPLIDPEASSFSWLALHAGSVVSGIVVAATLTWSPGPARGWELMGGKRFTLFAGIVAATVVLFAKAPGVHGSHESVLTSIGSVMLIGGAVLAGGTWSRTGRRAALLLVPVVLLAVLLWALPLDLSTAVLAATWYSVTVVSVLAVVGRPRWAHARPA